MDEPLCELETDKVTIEVPAKALAFWKRFCLRKARQWKLVLCWGQLMLRAHAAPAETPAAEAPTPEPAAPAEPVAPAAPPPPKHKVMRWHPPCGGWSANTGCHRPISRRPAKMVG